MYSSIEFIFGGISKLFKWHPLKALESIDVIDEGKNISISSEHSLKAHFPIFVKEEHLLNDIFFNEEHSLNAKSPILVNNEDEELKPNLLKFRHPLR